MARESLGGRRKIQPALPHLGEMPVNPEGNDSLARSLPKPFVLESSVRPVEQDTFEY